MHPHGISLAGIVGGITRPNGPKEDALLLLLLWLLVMSRVASITRVCALVHNSCFVTLPHPSPAKHEHCSSIDRQRKR